MTDRRSTQASNSGLRSLFSRFSGISIATVDTALPQYSPVSDGEGMQDPPAFDSDLPSPITEVGETGGPSSPPYEENLASSTPLVLNPRPRHSTILTWTPQPASSYNHEFEYRYPIRPHKPWATLCLRTRDSVPGNPRPTQNQPKIPHIWGCDPISGLVELDLDSPQTFQEIKLVLKGKIMISSFDQGSYQFLTKQLSLWKRSSGDPRDSTNLGDTETLKGKFDGKLVGNYDFPFSIPFPTYVDPASRAVVSMRESDISPSLSPIEAVSPFEMASDEHTKVSPWTRKTGSSSNQNFLSHQLVPTSSTAIMEQMASPTPQTFIERGITATVTYTIAVLFIHGWFKHESRIKTNITYLPASQPLPASQKRQQAYEAGAFIPGPLNDPDGWFTLPNATIRGTITCHGWHRQTKIDCKLYLAQPLSYTRGTVIPCYLTIYSDDAKALDIISTPKTPIVRLMRRITHIEQVVTDQDKANATPGFECSFTARATPLVVTPHLKTLDQSSTLKSVFHEVAMAVWWVPPKDVPQQTHVRFLEGEIHLDWGLQPSCTCHIFSVEYDVEMLPLQSVDFEPNQVSPVPLWNERAQENVIASTPVEITTLRRLDEPMPVSFTEPARVSMRRIPLKDVIAEELE